MRKYHRYLAVLAVVFGLFISITGLMVQSLDLSSELRSAPASDPTMLGRRAGLFGPPNFVVIEVPDYSAKALAAGFDYSAALKTAFRSPAAVGNKTGAPVLFPAMIIGAMAYGTYEFTSYAIMRDWHWQMVATDFIWGTVLTGLSAWGGVMITRAFTAG